MYIGVVRDKSYKVGGWWSLACTLGATWEGVTSGEGNIHVTRRFEGAGLTVFAWSDRGAIHLILIRGAGPGTPADLFFTSLF
jgi:hypothetical protein